jgi:hypothetical protein
MIQWALALRISNEVLLLVTPLFALVWSFMVCACGVCCVGAHACCKQTRPLQSCAPTFSQLVGDAAGVFNLIRRLFSCSQRSSKNKVKTHVLPTPPPRIRAPLSYFTSRDNNCSLVLYMLGVRFRYPTMRGARAGDGDVDVDDDADGDDRVMMKVMMVMMVMMLMMMTMAMVMVMMLMVAMMTNKTQRTNNMVRLTFFRHVTLHS